MNGYEGSTRSLATGKCSATVHKSDSETGPLIGWIDSMNDAKYVKNDEHRVSATCNDAVIKVGRTLPTTPNNC